MKIAVTVGRLPGESEFRVITDPSVPQNNQLLEYKELIRQDGGGYAEIMVISSTGGRIKRKRFVKSEEAATLKEGKPLETTADDVEETDEDFGV